ncbi:MAG: phosphoribosylanthranilate isomerase [Myxococcales bacterium]
MTRAPSIKICGLVDPASAVAVVDLGADAVGLNFVPASPRCLDPSQARMIADAVRGRALVIGVFANATEDLLRRVRDDVGLDRIQLHGEESRELVARLFPHAFKALRVADEADVIAARSFPGTWLLVDAKVPGVLGGSGVTFDWSLVVALARSRPIVLAGGLTPDNVADAIRVVRPAWVDVASGVERGAPGVKDLGRVRAFVDAVRNA